MPITVLMENHMNEFIQIPAGAFWGAVGTAIVSVGGVFWKSLQWVGKKLEAERNERKAAFEEQSGLLRACNDKHSEEKIKNAELKTRVDMMEKYTGAAFASSVATATAEAVVKALHQAGGGVQS